MKGDTYKETMHDGSISYPVIRVASPPGQGKHAKTHEQAARRHMINQMRRKGELNSVYGAVAFTLYMMTRKERI